MLKMLLAATALLIGADAWAADTATFTTTATATATATSTPTAAPTNTPEPGRAIGTGSAITGSDVLVVPASAQRGQLIIVADVAYQLRNRFGQAVGFPLAANQPFNATQPQARDAYWIRATSSGGTFYWWEWPK